LIHLRYNLVPERFVGEGRLAAVGFRSPIGQSVLLPAATAFRSIGYRSRPLSGLPFDDKSHTIPHVEGRICDPAGPIPGLYVAGWAKRGPSGVIGTNRKDAVETVGSLINDFRVGAIGTGRSTSPLGGLSRDGVVDWNGWQAIDRAEVDHGASCGRPRVKLHGFQAMLDTAGAAAPVG
jgi:ferredoxin--NADP+ reductase